MEDNYSFRTYIKDIFLEVPKYRFSHHPYFGSNNKKNKSTFFSSNKDSKKEKNSIFIGREKILNGFMNTLLNTDGNNKKSGVYLVTGYRGMGKTSFVNKVIERYRENINREKKEVKDIKISLAQSKLEEIDILRHIVKKLYEDIKDSKDSIADKVKVNVNQFYLFIFIIVYFLLIYLSINYLDNKSDLKTDELLKNIVQLILGLVTVAFGITFLIFLKIKLLKVHIYDRWFGRRKRKIEQLYEQLNNLHDRCFSSVIKENTESGGVKDIVNFFQKKSVTYPIANIKEIEYEIVEILENYTGITNKELIFIFDELDKIEPELDKSFYQSQQDESVKTYLNDLRERKQIIIKVLSSLKYLLTEAKARFIFIAGREMFDAALADIADRQSSLSSIFHQIIYVESFLRENSSNSFPNKNGINYLVEKYLEEILLPPFVFNIFNNEPFLKDETFLRKYSIYLKYLYSPNFELKNSSNIIIKDEAIIKIIFTLQNFITYLAYRSNGSPKKLIKLIEEDFIDAETMQKSTSKGLDEYGKAIYDFKKFDEDNLSLVISNNNDDAKNNIYLNLSFKQQYKYGFNSYLFYPFISMQNNTISNYSDSVLVSTPFLIDNLLKFHPFAFSSHNLELIPENLSTNKTPELRYFIEELINYLSQNHIRETETGLFHYKYFDRIHNEISFISKIFDEESAAFNFSLDESHAIKSHISSKIKFLRTTFKDFKAAKGPSIDSISFLNDILGDSQLFDEFYEDAIIAFLDSIHGIETPSPNNTPIDVFLAWMRVKLKLAMVYEKMKYYEQAMAQLGLAMNTAIKYITEDKILQNITEDKSSQNTIGDTKKGRKEKKKPESNDKEQAITVINQQVSKGTNQSSPLYREILHVTQQAILASMYVQEKFAEGLTFAKLENYLQLYAEIHKHESYVGYEGRDLMMSNFYVHLGTLLFYKNKTLPFRTTLQIAQIKNEPDYISKATAIISNTPLYKTGTKNDAVFFNEYTESSFNEIGYFTPNYGIGKSESYYRDFRFSFTTYVTYKKSLATLLAIQEEQSNISITNLMNESVKLLMNFRNVNASRKLISLANLITKLADLLITLFRIDENTRVRSNNILKVWRKNYNKYLNTDFSLITKLDYSAFGEDNYSFVTTWNNQGQVNFDFILMMYYLSGRIYLKAGRSVTAAFQFKKILLALHNCKPFGKISTTSERQELKKLNKFIEETILTKILKLTSWNSNSSDRPQISTNKYILGLKNISLPKELTRKIYLNLSNNPDTKEAILLYSDLRIRTYGTDLKYENLKNTIVELNIINPYSSISHQMVRIMELSIQVRINTLILARIINPKLTLKKVYKNNTTNTKVSFSFLGKRVDNQHSYWNETLYQVSYKYDPESDNFLNLINDEEIEDGNLIKCVFEYFIKLTDNDKIEYFKSYTELIVNSLFCLNQIITGLNLYGTNYMQNYSYLASFHEKMGDWLKHYGFCKLLRVKLKNQKSNCAIKDILRNMMKNIENLIGNNSIRNIEDSLSHYQMAFQYYNKAVQMHSEGITYKSQLNNMIYLEDDYNDNLNHFGAALERQQINSGKIRAKLQKLEKELQISRLYNVDNFYNE